VSKIFLLDIANVTNLGYPSTSAANFIDYFVGDKISTPPALWPYFSEKIILMPHTYQVTEHKMHYPDIHSGTQYYYRHIVKLTPLK